MKTSSQKKNVLFQMILLIGFMIVFAGGIEQVFAYSHAETDRQIQTIYVAAGDTLWSIAARYTSPKEDIREMIYHIENLNGLSHNGRIYPGQALKIPAKPSVSHPASEENKTLFSRWF